jgi:hypothetical protein
MRAFYLGLSTKSKSYIDLKSGKTFLELTTAEAQNLLDGILLDRKIYDGTLQTYLVSHLMIDMRSMKE